MTFKNLLIYGLLLWLLLGITKFFAFYVLSIEVGVVRLLFGLLTVLLSMAISRRLGTINYLESVLVAVFWFMMVIFLDFLVLGPILGMGYFTRWETWVGYALMMVGIFLFHDKRHVKIRKEILARSKTGH